MEPCRRVLVTNETVVERKWSEVNFRTSALNKLFKGLCHFVAHKEGSDWFISRSTAVTTLNVSSFRVLYKLGSTLLDPEVWLWFIRRPPPGSSATGWSNSNSSTLPTLTATAQLRGAGPWHIETPICCLPFRRTAASCTDPSVTSAGVFTDVVA
jgi:hypothetical protein